MMLQRRLAGAVMKCSPKRVRFDPNKLAEIKEAITHQDIRGLVGAGVIARTPKKGISRSRAKKRALQRQKGRQKNSGSRKGTHNARFPAKREWINRIRKQRAFISELKEKGIIQTTMVKELYQKAKGGYFRSKGHLKLYLNERLPKQK